MKGNRIFTNPSVGIALVALFCIGVSAQPSDDSTKSCEPASRRTKILADFESLRYGMFICFGMNTFTGHDYDEGLSPSTTYAPTELDVRQWVRVAKQAGMKYAVLTVKHMSGHCLWDSEKYDYDVATSSDKTDVVGEFIEACKTEGIQPGFYYCILDPRNEGGLDWGGGINQEYFALIKHHLTELHTRHPGICEQWIDIPSKLSSDQRWELYRLVKRLSPDCLVLMNQGFRDGVEVPMG
ncbi:MAG: alpha-L-fucosidase, partial [bacterium]